MDEFLPILGFGIGGYRSFGAEIQRFGPCGKINVLIGQNNSGKSNALRFLQHLYNNLSPEKGFPKLEGLEEHVSATRVRTGLSVGVRLSEEVRKAWLKALRPNQLDVLLGKFQACGPGYWLNLELITGHNRLIPTSEMADAVSTVFGKRARFDH